MFPNKTKINRPLSVYVNVFPRLRLSACVYVCLSVSLSVYMFVCLSFSLYPPNYKLQET